MDTHNIDKTSRMAIRKLIKVAKYYADTQYCEKDCDCDACKAIRYGKKQEAKLTYKIKTSKRAIHLAAGGGV